MTSFGAWTRKVILRRFIGNRNEQRYWEWRYAHGKIQRNPSYRLEMEAKVRNVMALNGCKNILEVGCGVENLNGLPNYTGLDFSLKGLKKSKLDTFIFADITKRIPVPDKTFDAVFCSGVLMHIKPQKIEKAVAEMSRVAKLVILDEPRVKVKAFNCWDYDYNVLFSGVPHVIVTEERLL